MKLIIQIPCLNEEEALPVTLKDMPKSIDGIDDMEILVIDDGSTDRTSEVAKEYGVNHILRFKRHVGLARAFKSGMEYSLGLGADIIVNIDADNQYCGEDIAKLVKPILAGSADMAIGDRQILKNNRQGPIKGILQFAGSWVVSRLSGIRIKDVTSGFRAFSREAATQLNITSDFSYTLESIIQAGEKGLVIVDVPVKTNKPLRRSRLFRNNLHYIKRSIGTLIKIYVAYEGFRFFLTSGSLLVFSGAALVLRYLYFYVLNLNPAGHLQSLIIASVLLTMGFLVIILGILTELICSTRKITEEILTKIKKGK